IPLLQERALDAAPAAPTLVTAVSASAFNLGIAGGALLGGRALDAGLGLPDLAWLGAAVALTALIPVLAPAVARPARTTDPPGGTPRNCVPNPCPIEGKSTP
ncbi:MAG: MFS transporter, partial [Streptomycetaceae bacterium]|nr:MFS transporter [Streptomycetaceae bacterium]